MAEIVLRPGSLFFYDGVARSPFDLFDDPGTYPSGPVWADDDDASYFTISGYTISDPLEQHSTPASADFETRLPATVLGVELAVKLSWVNPDTTSTLGLILSDAESGERLDESQQFDNTMPASPTWYTEQFMFGYYSGSRLIRVTAYDQGANSATMTPTLRVYEVKLTVFLDTPAAHAPPLRLFPRSDGRGASSAARVWPRPPTGNYGRVGPGSLV